MNQITKDHILSAIQEINEQGIRPGRHSSTYDLVYEGKLYPPKLVISIANKYATGEELDPNTFAGGKGTEAFKVLEKEGFTVVNKEEITSDFINVKEEFIDWMVANVSGGNYFANQFASNRERFEKEMNAYEAKYKESFNRDLFIINATDFKNEIELLSTNLYNTKTPFSEYSNNHAAGRPKAILGRKNYLRFLNERLSQMNTVNYWIFQGSPKIYNAVDALNANAVKTWTVSAHKDKIKKGDKFILWQTGPNAGCVAIGMVDSEVMMMKEEAIEMGYYLTPTPQIDNTRVKIVIEHNLADNPVPWEWVKENADFEDFKGGSQGTNFTATKAQYDAIVSFVNSNSSNAYARVKKVLHQRKLQSYLSFLRNYLKEHNIQPNDNRISFNVWKRIIGWFF